MQKINRFKGLVATAAVAVSGPAFADEALVTEKLAFEAIQAGKYDVAITELEGQAGSRDPAALINLGHAYRKSGQYDAAEATLQRAVRTRTRYDIALADGRRMDSRDAAQQALNNLERARSQMSSR